MSDIGEDAAQKPQDQAAPPTEAPPATEAKKTDDGQGGLKEVDLEELLERAKMDAPVAEPGAKPEQAESQKQDASKKEIVPNDMSILEKARQLLDQEAQEKTLDANLDLTKDLQQDEAGAQGPEQDKGATQIGDTPGAEKAADAEKKDAAEAKEEGKQGPGDKAQPTEVLAAEDGADAKVKE